jgi:hypothetical protein
MQCHVMSFNLPPSAQPRWNNAPLQLHCAAFSSSKTLCLDQKHNTPMQRVSKTQAARGQGHGHLPSSRQAEVAVALIGPWTIKLRGQKHKFMALMSMNAVTNGRKITCLNNKTSLRVAQQFENSLLSRHPAQCHALIPRNRVHRS